MQWEQMQQCDGKRSSMAVGKEAAWQWEKKQQKQQQQLANGRYVVIVAQGSLPKVQAALCLPDGAAARQAGTH